MLILTRRINHRVRLTVPGELLKSGKPLDLFIEVVEIRTGRVKLGFDGTKDISVVRSELVEDRIPKVSVSP